MPPPKKDVTSTTLASEKAHKIVSKVVASAVTKMIPYSVRGYTIVPRDFQAVAKEIEQGRIKVMFFQGESRRLHAGYVGKSEEAMPASGYMLLPKWSAAQKDGKTKTDYRGNIVHEAVHAIFDLRGKKKSYKMSFVDDECAAYIGEAIFLIKSGKLASDFAQPRKKGWKTDHPSWPAWGVARSMLVTNKTNAEAHPDLFQELRRAVLYFYHGSEERTKDG